MTLRAVCRKAVRLVIGICCRCIVCAVTLVARRIRKLVVAVHVAGLALHGLVKSGQRKFRRRMVERRRLPGERGMTHCAVLGKSA